MDMVQSAGDVEEPEEQVAVPEKVNSQKRVRALANVLLVVGWLLLLADGAGLIMVVVNYHENLGATMVVFGLFGGILSISGVVLLQQRLQKNVQESSGSQAD